LRHCTATGNWVLFIDGRYEMHGYEPIHTPEFTISFKLRPNDVQIAVVRTKNLVTHHRLLINKAEIMSFENQPADAFNEAPPQKVYINKYDIRNEGGKPVAYYEITTITSDGRQVKSICMCCSYCKSTVTADVIVYYCNNFLYTCCCAQ
jgi:hypothetical protein